MLPAKSGSIIKKLLTAETQFIKNHEQIDSGRSFYYMQTCIIKL